MKIIKMSRVGITPPQLFFFSPHLFFCLVYLYYYYHYYYYVFLEKSLWWWDFKPENVYDFHEQEEIKLLKMKEKPKPNFQGIPRFRP